MSGFPDLFFKSKCIELFFFAKTDHDLSLTTLKISSVKIYSNTLGTESIISKLLHALATWIAANLIWPVSLKLIRYEETPLHLQSECGTGTNCK